MANEYEQLNLTRTKPPNALFIMNSYGRSNYHQNQGSPTMAKWMSKSDDASRQEIRLEVRPVRNIYII